ncbi:XdhC and CoxI family [Bordetella pertussis]|uniref:XdhC family protein n=1 Tax=Bordetella pertussis TaxID=520 RepID=UPI0005E7B8EC|nr:XdhC and CoxI family [Bordetella pertussis]
MQAADLYVLQTAQSWLDAGQAAVLLTVARTWGSSPRPPGAGHLRRGRRAGAPAVAGSVSGGCIEDDLIDQIRQRGIAALCPGARPVP